MALPGLGGDDLPEIEEQEEVVHELQPAHEWRFEVAFTEKVEVRLISGDAEIFGTELAPQHTYIFRGVKAAVYTFSGCKLSSKGALQSDYDAEDTPMVQYANLHFALQQIRDGGGDGPRVLITGSPCSGKTSLAKTLAAYALRNSNAGVMAINLDPSNGMLAPPGTLSAAVVESIVDPETDTGWGSAPTNGPMPVPVKLPLVYYYGHEDPETEEAAYKTLVSRLALSVIGRLNEDGDTRKAGAIIDCPSSLSSGKSTDAVEHVVSEFGVSVIVVLGNERLYGDMSRRFPSLQVVKVDRSGGAVEKDIMYATQSRREQVHEYFYGDARVALNPQASFMEWSDLAVYRLVDPSSVVVNTSFLPGGGADMETGEQKTIQHISEPDSELQGSILAVVNSDPTASLKDVRAASVLGFIHVTEIDDKRKRLKVLAPMSGRLPKRTLLWGPCPGQVEMDSAGNRS